MDLKPDSKDRKRVNTVSLYDWCQTFRHAKSQGQAVQAYGRIIDEVDNIIEAEVKRRLKERTGK
jgi:hypothetical protein